MGDPNRIELHFIDGPLQGARKQYQLDELIRNRTYLVYEPARMGVPKKVPTNSAIDYEEIVCAKFVYLWVEIPASYGVRRFAMCLERGIQS